MKFFIPLYSRKPALTLALCMIVVALLPMMGNWVFYAQAKHTVRDQQESIVDQSLQMTVQKLENDLHEMRSLAVRLRQTAWALEMPASQDVTLEHRLAFFEMISLLSEYFSDAPIYLNDIYIATQNADYVVTTEAVEEYDILAATDWGGGMTIRQLEALHASRASNLLVAVGENRLAFTQELSRGNQPALQGRRIVFILASNYFDELIRQYGLPEASYLLYDSAGQVISSSEAGPAQDSQFFTRVFDQGHYQLGAWIPTFYVSQTASSLSLLYYIVFCATMVTGALLVWRLSRRTAMPINQLVSYIRENYAANDDDDVEGLNLVFHAVEQMLEDHEENLRHKERYEEQARMRDLADALLGQSNIAHDRGVSYVVTCFPAQEHTSPGLMKDAIAAWQDDRYLARCVILSSDVYLLLEKRQGAMDENEAEQALESILQCLDDSGIAGIHCAMSLVHISSSEISTAYREASMAADCLMHRPELSILRFDTIRYSPEYFLRDWHHLDKQLIFARQLSDEEYEAAQESLASLFPEEFFQSPRSTLAQLHLSSLKYQFLHDIEALFSSAADAAELNRTFSREIISCKTHRELYDRMFLLISELINQSPRLEEKDQDAKVQQIKIYIRQNAHQQQLSVTAVAEIFGMPINRLSKLFSRYAGMGVLQYIHKIRIENACTLLLSDDPLTIAEVAARVGYTSTLTFTRAFKARYQMTPGEYRKAHLADS